MKQSVIVIGGGLAGSEAAWQLAERGHRVNLYEMRPQKTTGAHTSDKLGELVCSNSLGSKLPDRATGLLQQELRILGSKLLECADAVSLPAGGALAVDREAFAALVTQTIEQHPNINIVREEVKHIPEGPVIIATGPLTSSALAEDIGRTTGQQHLYFYDALAPIVVADSIDMSIAFQANRYGRGELADGDYINCPFTRDEYIAFAHAITQAETAELRDFELNDPLFFEGCLPIEQIAQRGEMTLAYGPMRPVGLTDPRTGRRPFAVVQLRRDNLAGSLYNIVGFQTNIRWGAQENILRMIPGLQNAEFVRMGQMHRNTFINSPTLLNATMQFRSRPTLFFAGQITGVEGYAGNIATGLVAALNLSNVLMSKGSFILPQTTMLGALCHYVSHAEPETFQPMKANLGILPDLEDPSRDKQQRKKQYVDRAIQDLRIMLQKAGDTHSLAM